MARLHEYQGKELLKTMGISIPKGGVASNIEEAEKILSEINGEVVLKAQAFITSRAAKGAIKFADSPEIAKNIASEMFNLEFNNFKVDKVLIEQKMPIKQEFYAGIIIDDTQKAPLLIFSSKGGSGIEEIAEKYPDCLVKKHIDIKEGLTDYDARNLVRSLGISGKVQSRLSDALINLWKTAKNYEARTAEINPLVLTEDGNIYAADCRITIDDYAVFRHPELNIEIAREFSRPPGKLDIIAYNVEKNDYRGTFYFIQMAENFKKNEGYIGFHGAGGGGSMMSMDAVLKQGFKLANYTDTSGNPPASKVYRAAKIILSQPNIDGYFGSGSGVASQEQFHSARGLVKAFREVNLSIPAVVRLGGNKEDLAVQILTEYTKDLLAKVEGYKRDDTVAFCVNRLRYLVNEMANNPQIPQKISKEPSFNQAYSFKTVTFGTVAIDYSKCSDCTSKVCVSSCISKILELKDNLPVLNITPEEAKKGKCIECLSCEQECYFKGNKAIKITLPIPGLD